MTVLRQSAIAKLEKVPEEKLNVIIQFMDGLVREAEGERKVWDLDRFIMPPTERGQRADDHVRGMRDDDRF